MSLTRKVAYNTFIQIMGKAVTTAISLVLIAALTRYLGVAGFGQYTTIFAFVTFVSVVADFGFFWILVREIAHPDADINKTTSNILTFRTIVGIVIFAACFGAGFFIPQYADFHPGIGIVALATLFLTLNSTYIGIFQNKLRMDKAALTDVLGRAIILGVTLYLINKNLGLNSILWAYALGNVINLGASAWLGRVYVKVRPAFDFTYWKQVFWQTLPMAIVLILNLLYFRTGTLMLSLMKGSVDVGIFGAPYKILEILLLFPAMFMGNVFPILTRYIHTQNERLQTALQKSFDFLVLLSVPIVLGVVFTSDRIIRIVGGQEFVTAQTISPVWGLSATAPLVLQILMVAVGVSFISHLFNFLVIALGKQSKMIWPNLVCVVVNITLNFILIPRISYIGAAISAVVTEILVLILSWWVAHKYVEIRLELKMVWKVLVAGAVLGLFLYFWAAPINLIILAILSLVIYLGVLWITKGINKEMIGSLIKKEE